MVRPVQFQIMALVADVTLASLTKQADTALTDTDLVTRPPRHLAVQSAAAAPATARRTARSARERLAREVQMTERRVQTRTRSPLHI